MTRAGEKECALLFVPELSDHLVSKLNAGIEPAELTSGFIKTNQTIDQASIVFKITIQFCLAVLAGSQQQSVSPQLRQ